MFQKEGHLKPFRLMSTAPGTCPECGVTHEPEQPHNQKSLAYQYSFYNNYGRWPTWKDALAHCNEEIKQVWIKELAKYGINGEEIDISSAGNADIQSKKGEAHG